MTTLKNEDLPREFLRRIETGEYARIGELFADDIVVEFPFGPPAEPIRGRAAAVENLMNVLPNFFSTIKFEIDAIYPVTDGSTFIVECHSTGTRVGGKPYANRYVQVFKLRDGKFTAWREYFNPLAITD